MQEVKALLALCAALEGSSFEPLVVQRHTRELREGLRHLSRYVSEQDQQIQTLKAQRSSLESQVMLLAQQPEPPQPKWDNELYGWYEEDDLDGYDSLSAA